MADQQDDPHPLLRRRRLRDRHARRPPHPRRPVPRRESRLHRSSTISFDHVDLVVVSHAAFDHLGDTEKIATRYGCPVICGGEVKAYLHGEGHSGEQIRATTWGIRVEVAGIEVQPVECHHWSQIRMPDGTFASGVPMAFVIYADEGVRFYHYGDTAIFSDMKLQAELYRPTIGCDRHRQPAGNSAPQSRCRDAC